MKQCGKCGQTIDINLFSKDKSHADGFSSQCKDCRNQYHRKNKAHYTQLRKKWREANPNKTKETLRLYYQRHKEKISLERKVYRKLNIEEIRLLEKRRRIFSRYGISEEDKNKLLKKQNGKCILCNHNIDGFSACVDHDHMNGNVRGLLCRSCNFALGLLGDSVEGIQKVLNYLKLNLQSPTS